MNLSINIFLGVVSGVITAMLLWLASRFVENSLLPWFKAVRYDGVDVAGEWKESNRDAFGCMTEHVLTLEQSALELSGIMITRVRSPGNSFDLTMRVTGKLWEGYITLSMMPVDRSITSVGIGLLKLHGGGVALVGSQCFRNVNTETVEVSHHFLARTHVPARQSWSPETTSPSASAATPTPTA